MKTTIKKLMVLMGVFFFSITTLQAQVGINTDDPKVTLHIARGADNGKAVDGVMVPRLTGDQLQAKDSLYGTDQQSAMVYITAAATLPSAKTQNVKSAGYYYFDGQIWQAEAVKSDLLDIDSTLKKVSIGGALIGGGAQFEINGASANAQAYNAGNTASIDFTKSNLAYTTANAGAFNITGLKDGGTYTLAVKGTVSGTASFSQPGITFYAVNNIPTSTGTHTLYTFVVMGSDAYVWMAKGFIAI